MEAVDCEGESCVYVGDHPQKDFVGARHWNWKTIRICREDGEYGKMVADVDDDADLSITSLYELQNILLRVLCKSQFFSRPPLG